MLTVYHGSRHDFDEFKFINLGKESGLSGAGPGIYFTTSKAEALTYGLIIYECQIDLLTEISNTNLSLNVSDIALLLKNIIGSGNTEDYYDEAKLYLKWSATDTNIIGFILNKYKDINKIMNCLAKQNYTHTEDKWSCDAGLNHTNYIFYDLNRITIVDKEYFDD